jgi:hypothetical protein
VISAPNETRADAALIWGKSFGLAALPAGSGFGQSV